MKIEALNATLNIQGCTIHPRESDNIRLGYGRIGFLVAGLKNYSLIPTEDLELVEEPEHTDIRSTPFCSHEESCEGCGKCKDKALEVAAEVFRALNEDNDGQYILGSELWNRFESAFTTCQPKGRK